ncbi:hypothetical protein N7468_003070 [Penicillium chermesinum]|uniref:Zn(2)-C6 fungal-type domain-containing protein n=1 Tax=Penicillium chermesinum TaxID=63820 RepID=A0A9W9P6J8_9EURO|nr:uncharacterized protein N7468_003070 [Penicillium chermesinum]KAJ5238451.1 hypothetical protein N7468_003070 [Penicillium chermesinum]KAJ6164109.1 hypothetical protein N7470_002781 [Penicillium chermesinum]
MSATSTPPSAPARKRAGRPKSKKGCITCKIRHVKCGEEKPACKQCTLSGRRCDGYNEATQKELRQEILKSVPRRSWAPSADHRIVLVPGTGQERQYVHFFCNETIRAMAGFFPSEFWNHRLPELSYHSPAVRHAVAAVGAMHERQLQGRLVSASTWRFLEQIKSPETASVELMLVQCLLFVCLEMLKGNIARAIEHTKGGLQILTGQLRENKETEPQRSFHMDLYQFFYRQNVQVALFGTAMTDIHGAPAFLASCPSHFHNISHARNCLTHLMNRGLAFSGKFQLPPVDLSSLEVTEDDIRKQQALLQECRTWYQAMQRLQAKSARSAEVHDPRAPSAILCSYHASVIWISCALAQHEMYYDNYFEDFAAIADHAENLIKIGKKSASYNNIELFNLDADVLPTLFYAMQRCRFPLLRRRLLAVYMEYPAREGMFNKAEHAARAKDLIELEEAPLSHLPVEERLPQEHHRVLKKATLHFKTQRPSSVCIRTRPVDGVKEEYQEWLE